MSDTYLKNVIEAALLAAGRPLEVADLAALFEEPVRPAKEQIRAALDALACDYAERGIELKETASGLRVQVRRELAEEISRLWPERPARYSRALLETLALIAYRQPITRGEIEAVRGVAVNPNIVKTLIERNWIRVVGQRDVPGRPELLGTTREFLDYFGLKRLEELPPLAELRAMADLNVQLELEPGSLAAPPSTDAGDSTTDTAAPAASVASLESTRWEDAPELPPAEPDVSKGPDALGDAFGDELDEDEREPGEDTGGSTEMVAAPSGDGPAID